MTNSLFPFWPSVAWPSLTLPQGNVTQSFAPLFTQQVDVNYAGSRAIEQAVVTDVASFGRQLGRLIDAVTLLSADRPEEAFRELRTMAEAIAAVKDRARRSAAEEAHGALDALARADRAALDRLLASYRPPAP